MKYFNWTFSALPHSTWFVGEPRSVDGEVVDAWNFKKCERYATRQGGVVSAVKVQGSSAGCFFGAFDIPFVSEGVKGLLGGFEQDIQFIPVGINGVEYFILNVLAEVECVDEDVSLFSKWEGGSLIRPDKAGQYKYFEKLIVDAERAKGFNIFRLAGWRVALIVSEEFKSCIEKVGQGDTIFIPVWK